MRWVILFKTLIFGGLLIWVKISGFSFWSISIFLLITLFLFFKPLFQTLTYFLPFGIFSVLTLLFAYRLPDRFYWIGVLTSSILFFLILGIKNLIFVDRFRIYLIFHSILFYVMFLLFFTADRGGTLVFNTLILFLAAAALFRYLLKFGLEKLADRQERSIASLVLALLVVEIVWGISWLPIGFLASANLALLTVFILEDLVFKYFRGMLTRRVILSDATILALLTLLIFITSKWSI